jgi:hypothetical protein
VSEPIAKPLPPTSSDLLKDDGVPYFVWWLPCTVGDLKRWLRDPDPGLRAYWLGVLLREANTRDVWLFTTPDEVRAIWPQLLPHLGKARDVGVAARIAPANVATRAGATCVARSIGVS